MEQTYQVATPADFKRVIEGVLQAVLGDTLVIALSGDLGAGKTAFTQELAKYLGVTEPVTSPTFTIMKRYKLPYTKENDGRFTTLVHIDAYRLASEAEAAALKLGDTASEPHTLSCIEWPEHIPSFLPPYTIRIHITIGADEVREVVVDKITESK